MCTAEVFVDSTGEKLGEFRFGQEPEVDARLTVDGNEYIIVGTTEFVSPDAEFDYAVRLMPDHHDF